MNFSDILLVSDLDGTFLSHAGKPVPENMEALRRFKDGGGLFAFASGRVHTNIRSIFPDPAEVCNVPAVLCNGAYLYDFGKNEIIGGRLMKESDAGDVLAFLRASFPDATFRVSTPEKQRMEKLNDYLRRDIALYDAPAVEILSPAESWPQNDWFKLVVRGETEDLQTIEKAFNATFKGRLSFTFSGPHIAEIQPPEINKGLGLRTLRELVGKGRTLVAMGDYDNDRAMLSEADIAFCPQNALPELKALADRIGPDCDRGLLAFALEELEKMLG